ncbi:Sugar-binding periplasmic protein [Nostocoides jenkinsii Ben 74]|uniref:Sugar-binding periplasmic protein n=2 Tax=Nostocoides jenkinsii TaxID=330834 RepID=A0A077MB65_9MICO|nr:Sugar-binding periplasmic protein [Tetrasphaera jenkinsii Ben 74]
MMRNHRRFAALIFATAGSLTLAACGGGGFDSSLSSTTSAGASSSATGSSSETSAAVPSGVALRMLIASSGDAETAAVKAATDAWGKSTGNTVEVTAASNMDQELAQGFAGGDPADVMYMDAGKFATFAQQGSLEAYGDGFPDNDKFFESLRKTFTWDGKQYCVPKDFSALALQINTDMWSKAGLTDADIPTTWDQLTEVSKKLTTKDVAGLGIGVGIDRLGAFVVENGGWWLSEDGKTATAGDAKVVDGLKYVQDNVKAGNFKMSNDLGVGWGGEAFTKEKAAMVIEGNWIKGALKNDAPNVKYKSVELPAGPAGKGTLMFTQCWGLAADSKNKDAAKDLIKFLTTSQQQMAFADAFGVMPSRTDAAEEYKAKYPDDAAFVAGGEYGHGPINVPGLTEVVADLNSQLEKFGDADLAAVTKSFDENAASALGG